MGILEGAYWQTSRAANNGPKQQCSTLPTVTTHRLVRAGELALGKAGQEWKEEHCQEQRHVVRLDSSEKVSFCFFSLRDEKWMLWPSRGNQLLSVSLTFSNLLIMNMALCNIARLDQAIIARMSQTCWIPSAYHNFRKDKIKSRINKNKDKLA